MFFFRQAIKMAVSAPRERIIDGEVWHSMDLTLSNKTDTSKKALLNYLVRENKTLDVDGFKKLMDDKMMRIISCQLQPHVFFAVIQEGNINKLAVLRNLPSFDQVPLFFLDQTTGVTTLNASNNITMKLSVNTIITKQRIELESGREALKVRGYANNSL